MSRQEANLDDKTPLVEMQKMPTGGASDLTLKTDIQEISGLGYILRLRPVTWRWTAKREERREYGFIAQEVEAVLPQLVSYRTWDDGTDRKYLSTKEMIPLLVAALREQQAQVKALQESVEQLRSSD
ncbi:MAG TPA: tail fiber domain-containing protein [Candidatus Saccharimonadales bacterium]